MCIKTMSLEISEITHVRRSLIVVGTSFVLGEDLSAKGRIYVFDIIEVVPEPDFPETSHKLKLIAKEEVKGAVTSLSEVGMEGFLLVAQGQKCMVRGLKEDGTLLPVAFIDAQCYITVAKELKGSGLCIMADAIKGVWLTGYLVHRKKNVCCMPSLIGSRKILTSSDCSARARSISKSWPQSFCRTAKISISSLGTRKETCTSSNSILTVSTPRRNPQ